MEFAGEVAKRVEILSGNIKTLVRILNSEKLRTELRQISVTVSSLAENVPHLVASSQGAIRALTEEEKEELATLKMKYAHLQTEWESQQKHLGRLEADVEKMRKQLVTQSAFCASLGSIMGNLVWKASRLQPVVQLLLTTNKLTEFFCIVSGTLVSFLETYYKEIPNIKSDETQFVLSMGGIIANVAAVPEGRQYLVTDVNGKELVEQIVKLLPTIPAFSGDPLKRILFMVLYNVSINQYGLALIQDQKPLLVAISHTLLCQRSVELKIIVLRLLESITSEIACVSALVTIRQHIPLPRIMQFEFSEELEEREHATNILKNIRKAADNLKLSAESPCEYALLMGAISK